MRRVAVFGETAKIFLVDTNGYHHTNARKIL